MCAKDKRREQGESFDHNASLTPVKKEEKGKKDCIGRLSDYSRYLKKVKLG